MPELNLRKIFPTVYFVNKNLSEERVQVLLIETELNQLPDNSQNRVNKSNNDCYMEKSRATFCDWKHCVLNDFYYAKFSAYYTLENKWSKTCGFQPDKLDDNFIENNHDDCSYPPKNELIISEDTIQCRKVRQILRYHVPNEHLSLEKFVHHMLLLFQ